MSLEISTNQASLAHVIGHFIVEELCLCPKTSCKVELEFTEVSFIA